MNRTSASKQPQWDKFGESDLSISSDDHDVKPDTKPEASPSLGSGGSKFLKKKSATSPTVDSAVKKPQTSGAGPRVSKIFSKSQQPVYGSKSSALSKAAAITGKYSLPKKQDVVQLSESDLDMDLSMDEDVMADVRALKKPQAASASLTPKTIKSNKKSSKLSSPSMSFSDDSEPIGKGSNIFMKKKAPTPAAARRKSIDSDTESDFGKAGNKFMKKTPAKRASPVPTTPRSPAAGEY